MKQNLQNKSSRLLSVVCMFLLMLCAAQSSYAQLTGNIPVSGTSLNYPTIKAMVDSLNMYAPGPGGVTFDVAAGLIETAPLATGGYKLTASGTAANPIIIRKDPATVGPNPVINAYAGAGTTDGVFFLLGCDYVTIDGIDIKESTSNSNAASQMEWGYVFLNKNLTAPYNGCSNNTIKNSSITLNRDNTNSKGIYLSHHLPTSSTPYPLSTPGLGVGDDNSNNKFYANKIQNVWYGIYMVGFDDPTYTFRDKNNDIGGNSYATADTITGLGVGVAAPLSGGAHGVYMTNQTNPNVSYNFIDNALGGVPGTGAVLGILAVGGSANLNNHLTITHNTINITQGSSGVSFCANIQNYDGNVTVTHNDIKLLVAGAATGTGAQTGISVTHSTVALGTATLSFKYNTAQKFTISNSTGLITIFNLVGTNQSNQDISYNTIDSVTRTNGGNGASFYGFYSGTSNTVYGYVVAGSSVNVYNNVITNITLSYTAGSSQFYGIQSIGHLTNNYYNNTIDNIISTNPAGLVAITGILQNGGGDNNIYNNTISNLTGSRDVHGIYTDRSSKSLTVYNNKVFNLTSTGVLAAPGYTACGITFATLGITFTKVYNNKIYAITQTSNGVATAQGINIVGGAPNGSGAVPLYIYNNIIGNIKTLLSAIIGTPSVIGINLGANANLYNAYIRYNSIYLNDTAGANTHSAAIYHNIATKLVLNNNLLVNKTFHATGTGMACGIMRSGASLVTYDISSGNNLIYAGIVSSRNMIHFDGTNRDSAMSIFKGRITPREGGSVTQNITMFDAMSTPSVISTSVNYLQNDTTVGSMIESGAENIGGITTDIRGMIRQGNPGYAGTGSKPDIGAFESQGPRINMVYDSVLVIKDNKNAIANSANQQVVNIQVFVSGSISVLSATQFSLTTAGTTNVANITRAKLFYCGASATLSTAAPFGSAVISPNGTFTFTGSQPLISGVNNFWLVYDIAPAAIVGHIVNADVTNVVVSSVTKTPLYGNPIGSKIISAQLSGVYTLGSGPYTTLADIISALNTNGISADVTVNIPAYFTETAPSNGGYLLGSTVLNSTLNAGRKLVFQKAGVGTNPLLTASAGNTTNLDGIFTIQGADYVTIDGIDLKDDSTINLIPTTRMEWGYGLLKLNNTAPFDGCQNITIKNSTVTLVRTNTNSKGIYVNNHIVGDITNLSITSPTDANSYNTFITDSVQNVNTGIYINGFATSSSIVDFGLYDINNTIGDVNAGNIIVNYGGAVAGFGINVINQTGAKIGYNFIDNFNNGIDGAIGAGVLLTGIQHTYTNTSSANPSNVKVLYNQVNLAMGATSTSGLTNISVIYSHGDVTIDNNSFKWKSLGSGSSGAVLTGINFNSVGSNQLANKLSVKGNVAKDFTFTKTGTGNDVFFNLAGSAVTEDISYDTILRVTRASGGTPFTGTVTLINSIGTGNPGAASNASLVRNVHHNYIVGYDNGSTSTGGIVGIGVGGTYTINVYNNTISSLTHLGGTAGMLIGIFCNNNSLNAQFYNIYDNRIDTLTSTGGFTWGINFVNNGQGANIYGNVISNLTAGGAGAQTALGIYLQSCGRNFKFYNNRIYGLKNNTTGLGYTAGVYLNGVGLNAFLYSSAKFYNNLIGNLSSPNATITATPSVMGMALGMNTVYPMIDVYHNTILLAGATANNIGSAGIYLGGTPTVPIYKINNNIISNKITPAGTGVASAIQRVTGGAINAIDKSSNNNILFAGTTSASNVLYCEGANKDQTVLAYQTRMYPREGLSAREDVLFITTDGTSPYFLYPDSTVGTTVSNGAVKIQEISTDYTNRTRSSTFPDIGAYEGNYTAGADVLAPAVVATVLTNISETQSVVSLTAVVKDASGTSTVASLNGPRVYYKKFGMTTYTSDPGTLVSGTHTDGVWSFTMSPLNLTLSNWAYGDTIYYYVAAQDNVSNLGSAPSGAVGTGVTAITTEPTPLKFVVKKGMAGLYTVCATGCDFTSLTNTFGAFDSLNRCAITANVTLRIDGDTLNETGTIALNQIAQNGNYGVKIIPGNASEKLIVGNSATGLINFNGADNITIDGRVAGSGKYLRIRNRNTSGNAIRFSNDAHLDTVKFATLESVASLSTVYFATSAADGTGNDSNAIMNCDIRDTLGNGNSPSLTNMIVHGIGVYSDGLMNSENTIANNNIYNFLNQGVGLGSAGLSQDNWVITNNKFYQQPAAAAKAPSIASPYTQVILLNSGQGHTVTNNSIGGSAQDRSGNAWKGGSPAAAAMTFKGIEIGTNLLLDRPITISGNTISNIDANPSGNIAGFSGISVLSGIVNITNNVIGGGAMPYDTIKEGSATALATGGIVLTGGVITVENNMIGNYFNYLPNVSQAITTTVVKTAGINIVGGGANGSLLFTVKNNIIHDIKSNYTYVPPMNSAPTNYLTPQGTSPVGIVVTATAGDVNIEGNTIYNIINTSTTGVNNQANGITVRGSSAVCSIKRNKVYGIGSTGNGSGSNANGLYGIYIAVNPNSIGSVVQNNQIAIAPGTADESNVFGIVDGSTNSFTRIANNSVYVGGTALGNNNSYGLLLGAASSITIDSVYNNIFYNGRTGGGASHFAVGAYYAASVINPSRFGYNLMVSPSATTMMELYAGTSLNSTAVNAMYTSQFVNSNWMETSANIPAAGLFANTANGDLGLNAVNAASWYANGKGLPMASVTNDFTGAVRSTTIAGGATDIGSMEVTSSATPASAVASAAPALNTTTTYTYGGRTVASVTWGAAGTVPTALDVKYYSGTNAPSLLPGKTQYNAYYAVTPTGGTGYTYTIALGYDSAVMGNVSATVPSRMAYYKSPNWALVASSSANSVSGMLLSGGSLAATTLPANFTGTNMNNALPVKLVKFTATAVTGDVQLGWTTASEINNAGFAVERSTDGESFDAVGFVKGAGTTGKVLNYGLTDTKAFVMAGSNSLYYRLKQIDVDGIVSYSNVINVTEETNETMSMSLYPNPAADMFTVSAIAKSAGKITITIYDIQGKVVTTFSREVVEGKNAVTINSALNGTGIYFVKVMVDGESKVMKLIKN